MPGWNPWHGCRRYSEGCAHCYVYRIDEGVGRDPTSVFRTGDYDLPARRRRSGEYALCPRGGEVYTCLSSDFFLEEADEWRPEAWRMMRMRADIRFVIITKRVLRIGECLPEDWGEGYPNVRVCATVENQRRAEERMPVFLALPLPDRGVVCEPLLERIDLSPWLDRRVSALIAGGESGPDARVCDYEWVLDLRAQCQRAKIAFRFKQTGARFRKDGRLYAIDRRDQIPQARKAGIDLYARL